MYYIILYCNYQVVINNNSVKEVMGTNKNIVYISEDGGEPTPVTDSRRSSTSKNGKANKGVTHLDRLARRGLCELPNGETDKRKTGENNFSMLSLLDNHQEITRRIVLGQSNKQIAVDMGLTKQYVSKIRNNPMVRRRIQFMQAAIDDETIDVGRRIKEVQGEAQLVLEELMHDKGTSANVRANIAENMLAKVGHGVPRNVNITQVGVVCDASFLQEQKERVKEEQRKMREMAEYAEVS